MLIVDAQVHIWGADSRDRPWPPGRAHQAQKPYPVTRDLVLAGMKEAGVDRAVLVPPSWEGDRNDLALAAPRRCPATPRSRIPSADSTSTSGRCMTPSVRGGCSGAPTGRGSRARGARP